MAEGIILRFGLECVKANSKARKDYSGAVELILELELTLELEARTGYRGGSPWSCRGSL